MNIKNNIDKLRTFMKKEGLDYFLVCDTDEYLNEYIELNDNSRYYVTGFTGSTGKALVTMDKVYLFVDGRYHLQAEEEVDKSLVDVVKLSMKQTFKTEFANIVYPKAKVGFVSLKLSIKEFNSIKKQASNLVYKEYRKDPLEGKVALSDKPIFLVNKEITGLSPAQKFNNISKNTKKDEAVLITKLDEIAYLTNLRSFEIPFNSTFKSKVLLTKDKCYVFCDLSRITEGLKQAFDGLFEFIKEEDFEKKLVELSKTLKTIYYDESSNLFNYRILKNTGIDIKSLDKSPIYDIKSIKNTNELKHMKECFRKTDIAMSRAITWLKQNIELGNEITEYDMAKEVEKYFFDEGALSLSFATILASGKNSAFIHYGTPSKDVQIKEGNIVLLDCGAYFEGGYATDITRTILASKKNTEASNLQKKIYTQVLKAHINAHMSKIKDDTTGFDIDKIVRDILNEDLEEGFSFSHGTGHGVGINVHEGPPYISPGELAKTKLLNGMVFTIEPGLYNEKFGGVRIENTVRIEDYKITTLAHCPYEEKLIDYSLLNENEIKFLENYKNLSI